MATIQTDHGTDFDFVLGRWRIHNRKLVDVLDPECTKWVEFEATSEARPILGGLGNVDTFLAPEMPPHGDRVEGVTLRLFDPESQLWRIWWASTRFPGQLDTPVEGRFEGDHGEFLCDDVLNGHPVKVRYDWRVLSETEIRWEQSFSYDGGSTWNANWVMSSVRDGDEE
jgi:hypothetical protein